MSRILYFDLETKYSADDVGGWNNSMDMGISVAVVWDTADESFHVYLEHQTLALIEHLKQADLIVGDETTRTIVNQAKSKVTLAGARGAAQEKAGGCDDEAGSMHRRHGRFQAAWLDSGSHSRARIATPLSAPRSFSQTAWLRSRREIRARAFR